MGQRLQRAQEIQQILLLAFRQSVKIPDDGVGLGARTGVILDGLQQIGSSPIMQKEQTLAQPPERSRTELVWSRTPLRYSIGQTRPHMVNQKIRE